MEVKLGRPHPYLNSYHKTESLLYQFILSEFLKTFSILIEIEKNAYQTRTHLHDWENPFTQLLGAYYNTILHISWSQEDGALSKLCIYVDILCKKWGTKEGKTDFKDLQNHVHQAKKIALDALEMIEENKLEQFLIFLADLQKVCQLLKKSLAKSIPNFKDDENVIFLVIKNCAQFSAIFGSDFVPILFKNMYPGGLEEGYTFLERAYEQRHFENLVPLIRTYFTHFESRL